MKKCIPVVLLGLVPYGVILSMIGANNVWDNGLPFGVPLICISGIAVGIVASAVALKKGWSGYTLALCNMIIKLIQVPAYMVIFIFALACCVNPIFMITFFMAIIAWMVDMALIAATGIVGATAAWVSYKEGAIEGKLALVFGICQFIFCVDVIAAIVMYIKARRNR